MENKNLLTKGARRKRSNRGKILFIIEILMGMTQQRRELRLRTDINQRSKISGNIKGEGTGHMLGIGLQLVENFIF